MQRTLIEAVKQRLEIVERDLGNELGRHDGGNMMEQQAQPYRLQLTDIEQLLEQHHAKGRAAGYNEGVAAGKAAGLVLGQHKRMHVDRLIFRAVLEETLLRLGVAAQQFTVPKPGGSGEAPPKDKRSKDELKAEALSLIDELRAGLGVLNVDNIPVVDERAEAYAKQRRADPTVKQALADLGAIEIINERHA